MRIPTPPATLQSKNLENAVLHFTREENLVTHLEVRRRRMRLICYHRNKLLAGEYVTYHKVFSVGDCDYLTMAGTFVWWWRGVHPFEPLPWLLFELVACRDFARNSKYQTW